MCVEEEGILKKFKKKERKDYRWEEDALILCLSGAAI